jgi:5-methylcytosine-specific restriction endonuclease McrA
MPLIKSMDAVLVLNANFEPINVCNMHRAVGMMVVEKATLVLNGRGVIKTAVQSFPKPSIIRLQRMVHRPRLKTRLTRKEVFRRDGFICQYCGSSSRELTIDHINPRHLGGEHIWTNVVTACALCNHRKGGRTLAQSGMHLMQTPLEPPTSAHYIFGKHLTDNLDWEPYLTGW